MDDLVDVELGLFGLEPEPAGGGGGVPGNTIGPPVGTCDAHRRLPKPENEYDSSDMVKMRQRAHLFYPLLPLLWFYG